MRAFVVLLILIIAIPAASIELARDVWVPAAARAGTWVTDLYIENPNDTGFNVTVYWFERGRENLFPDTKVFTVASGDTLVLSDVILTEFGYEEAAGAFRIVATRGVIVNSRIYSMESSGTFGQGFPGIPAGAATKEGSTATVVGLTSNSTFGTNIYGLAGIDGATLVLSLRRPSGSEIASRYVRLGEYEPFLKEVSGYLGSGSFDHATLVVEVIKGSAVVGASKVDLTSGDPTTLESSVPVGDIVSDGVYHFLMFDSELWSTGGLLTVLNEEAMISAATYMNWDKSPQCSLIFPFEVDSVFTLEELANGIVFEHSYDAGGELAFGVIILISKNMGLVGAVVVIGSGFTGQDSGCNGEFPALLMMGGKLRGDPQILDDKAEELKAMAWEALRKAGVK